MTRRYAALARVSSREQEREGFSLDVQEDALKRYAERQGGEIIKLYRIAETASKKDERRTFREMLGYAKEHAGKLDGLLFYKVDRAARNLFDYVELERLEADHGVPVVYVAQGTENTPAGRMQRRMLANMASFYTEQQSLDVREGMARRVESGLFVGRAPFGYRNVRTSGRSLVEIEPEQAYKVRRIFDLYAYHGHTIDSLGATLRKEGLSYSDGQPGFTRSKLHAMLRDRAYIGEVRHRGKWYPGTHEALLDLKTWERVQALLGGKTYRNRELTYAGSLVTCAHCGHPITGEMKMKKTGAGEKVYVYYRCTQYNRPGHPRVRVKEEELEQQVLSLFARIRIQDEAVRNWFLTVLKEQTKDVQAKKNEEQQRLQWELSRARRQVDALLTLRMNEEIDAQTFKEKRAELLLQIERLTLQTESLDRKHAEYADVAVKVFELSQSLAEKWVTADGSTKHKILEIVCLNCTLDGVTLTPTIRKPFDVLAEGRFLKDGRGERI